MISDSAMRTTRRPPLGERVAAAIAPYGWSRLGVLWLGILVLAFVLPANGVTSAFLHGASATAFGAIKDALVLGMFVLVVVTGRLRRVPVPIVVLVLMIVGLGLVSGVWTSSLTQAAYGWRNDFLPFLALIVTPAVLDRRHVPILATAFVAVSQLAAITTILTWSQGLKWLFTLGVFPVPTGAPFPSSLFVAGSIVPRGFSPYAAPNESAAVATMMLAVLWTRPRWPLWLKGTLTLLPLIAIYLTQSRSGYIGLAMLAVALVAWAVFRVRPAMVWALLTIMTAAGVAGVTLYLYIDKVISHVADPSLIGHSDSLLENVPFLVTHPFGYGLGMVGPRALTFSSDAILVESFFLLLAIESGVLVMLLFAVLLVYLFQGGLRARTLDGFLTSAVIAGSIVSFTVLPTLQEGPVAYTLWILCGMGIVAARSGGPGTARVHPRRLREDRDAAAADIDIRAGQADSAPQGRTSGTVPLRRTARRTAPARSAEGDDGGRGGRRGLRLPGDDGA
ncbi:O-antigen ligase [uncultured Microbacterium sp.]|uniref:O-antigen ligase family protein n=1 Tax=uncultured Microbacterium sp. TaxID=191216 RepID=UPI0025ED0ABB|nr:O-antigen ligase family protein [uncultured Microbacterium sp.]